MRFQKTLNHISDPTTHTEPGSDEASLISLDDADMNHFRGPSFAVSFPNLIYSKLAKWIADEDIKEKLKLKKGKLMTTLSSPQKMPESQSGVA